MVVRCGIVRDFYLLEMYCVFQVWCWPSLRKQVPSARSSPRRASWGSAQVPWPPAGRTSSSASRCSARPSPFASHSRTACTRRTRRWPRAAPSRCRASPATSRRPWTPRTSWATPFTTSTRSTSSTSSRARRSRRRSRTTRRLTRSANGSRSCRSSINCSFSIRSSSSMGTTCPSSTHRSAMAMSRSDHSTHTGNSSSDLCPTRAATMKKQPFSAPTMSSSKAFPWGSYPFMDIHLAGE